jgi:peptidylprolyl isomerase
MDVVENGDTVMVHYTGTLENGHIFDTTLDSEPLVFKVGAGKIIPGFEDELKGMKAFEKKKFKLEAKEAYGEYQEDLAQEVLRSNLPPDLKLEVGEILLIGESEEDALEFMITEVTEDKIKLDPNHPLAGKDLNFEVEVVAIKKKE